MTATLDPSTKADARALERLASEKIGWVTTVNADGQPQSSPVWFLVIDDDIFLYSGKNAPRNRNIQDNPRVAFNLHTDVGGGDIVSMEGTARIEADGPLCSGNPPYLTKYADMLEKEGGAGFMDREYPVRVWITPTRWRTG